MKYTCEMHSGHLLCFLQAGTISLIFKLKEGLTEQIMFITGIIFSILLINGCINRDNFIKKLINKMEKEN